MKKFICLTLVVITMLTVAASALALSGSYVPYLGGDGSSYNIRRGHQGNQVKNLQMLLNGTLGTHLSLDGIFGSGTEDAVEDFQRDYMGDSNPDGIVGKNTKKALWEACPVMPNLITVYN